MKAILYILFLAALLVSSCATSGRFVKNEFDDLYYLPSDRVMVDKSIAGHNLPGDLKQEEQYFDNIYSGDTLIAEQYNESVDFDNSQYSNNSPFEYIDDWSYSSRLRRFYGNYFYPYWRDPFYYSWNYSPWYYYDYYYNPYWGSLYDPFYYGMYYPGTYYGFYGTYFGSALSPYVFYSGYYTGYNWPGYHFYYKDDYSTAVEGRRVRYSSLTSNYTTAPRGRTSVNSSSTSGTAVTTTSRRTESTLGTAKPIGSNDSKTGQVAQSRRETTDATRNVDARPEYNQASRSYTPTYNNPRLIDRPSYNTSRVSTETVVHRSISNDRTGNTGGYRSNSDSYFNNVERRSSSSYSVGQTRSVYPSGSGDYSAPSMRSVTRDASVSSSRRYESSSFSSGMSSGSGSSGSGGSSFGSSGGGSSSGSVSTGTRR